MWKKVVALNLAIILTLVILPIRDILAFAESLNVEYVLFYKNNGTDESTSVSIDYKTTTSFGNLITYKTNLLSVAPEYTQEGKRVIGYNTNSDGSGTSYELLDAVEKGTFSNNESMPTSIYAQWYDAEDNSILYLSNLGLSESGNAYYIQSGLSDTATLAEGSIFAGKDGKKVVGWQTTDCEKTYFPGQTISITTNMTLIPVSGQNYFKLHYKEYDEDATAEIVIENKDDYSWYTNRMYRYEYNPNREQIFIGWNSEKDGSGEWYVKLDEDTPNNLYAQYEDYPEDSDYIILSCSTGLEGGKKSEFFIIDDTLQAVSLPSEVYSNQKVAYWSQDYGYFDYPAGEDIILSHFGYEFYPTIVGDDNQIGLIYSDGGYTDSWLGKYIGINYYMTSAGSMSIYNFNELEVFNKENNVFVGYKGNKTGKLYDYYDEIEPALKNEKDGDISKFTAYYEPVENGYIQYFGNGGLTSNGKGQYYEEIDFSNITTETYAENKFTHPDGENFLGWSTTLDEPSVIYRPGEKITLSENTILYAQWGDNAVITHETYYYGDENVEFYKNVKTAGELSYYSTLYNSDSYFKGWNTKVDGSGKWYVLDDEIPLGEVTELYEQREDVPDTGYYYIIFKAKQSDGTQLKIITMSTDKETITLPEYSGVEYWSNSETYDNIPRSGGFIDESEYIYSAGQEIEISSESVISPFNPYAGMITYNENFGNDNKIRVQYRITSPAGLKIYSPSEVFTNISDERIFIDWNTSPDGSGTSYKAGDYITKATLYAQWFTENSVISGSCGDNVMWKLTGDGTLTISGNGAMDDNSSWDDKKFWNYLKPCIKSVVIEEGITCIGEDAFYECTNLEKITIAKTVTEIGNSAFEGCKSLSGSVIISSNVTDLGYRAFSGCELLEGIVFKGDFPQISWNTFRGCTNLKSIGVKDLETWIDGAYYFEDCLANNNWDLYIDGKLLEDLVIPETVTWMNSNKTFYNCKSIKSVTFHNEFYQISDNMFANCINLSKINLSASINSIGKNAFYNTAFYNNETNWSDGILCLGNHLIKVKENVSGEYRIPVKITRIAYNAFEGTGVTKVYIHSGINNMQSAFANAMSITSVEIASGATYIPYRTFYNCTNLSEIIVPDSVYQIGQDAFTGTAFYNDDNNWENGGLYVGKVLVASDCDNTGSFTVKAGTKSISDSAFMNSSYDKFILPNSITYIGSQAFYNCTELIEITLPENLEQLSWGTFYGCTALKTVTLPDTITQMSSDIFRDCTSLETIYNMPVKLSWIGTPIFTNCKNLKDIYYEGTTAQWQKQYGDYSLGIDMSGVNVHCDGDDRPADSCGKELTWSLNEDGVFTVTGTGKMYDYEENDTPWEVNKEKIKELIIEDGVTKVGAYSFKNCPNLVTVKIPNSVNAFGTDAFDCTSKIRRNVYITDLTKWCGIKFTNAYANPVAWANLYVNNQLAEKLTIPEEVKEICDYAFFACYSLKEITLTKNVENAYNLWFYGCNNVTKITVDSKNSAYCDIDGILFSKDKTILYQYNRGITNDYYKVPDSVVRIDTQAVNGCNKLKTVVLPDGLVEIGYWTFTGDSSLSEITIPKTVTTIRQGAFSGCSALETVYYSGTYDEWDNISIEKENDYLIKAFTNNNKAQTKTTVSADGKTFTIKPINIASGNTVILALYNGDTFVEMQSKAYTGKDIPFTTDKAYTNAKVMVWDSLSSLKPVCDVEIVK